MPLTHTHSLLLLICCANSLQFATNIALIRGQEPVVGLVHIPCTCETYWAVKGKGSYVRRGGASKEDVRLECKEFSEEDEGITIITSRRHKSKDAQVRDK